MIQVGDTLPGGTLQEHIDVASEGCSLGPNAVDIAQASAGKTVVIFGLPGAFTPTCSARHAPGYIAQVDAFRAAGVDELWCVSVNDAFVMGAWARSLQAGGRVRFLGDGSAAWAQSTGLTQDLTARGMGLRSCRYAMRVQDGVVTHLKVEAPGAFEVSDADTMLKLCQGQG